MEKFSFEAGSSEPYQRYLGEMLDRFEQFEDRAHRGRASNSQYTSLCPGPLQETLSGFPRYQKDVRFLPPAEQAKIWAVAQRIVRSFQPGCTPLRGVLLVGHADHDLQRGPVFERQISVQRALQVRTALRIAITSSSRNSSAISPTAVLSSIDWVHRGDGALQLIVQNPATEQQRARNRRVEIFCVPRSYPTVRPFPVVASVS
jgi:outer membrane protein OmpA-like peptidoglycan-associated protein